MSLRGGLAKGLGVGRLLAVAAVVVFVLAAFGVEAGNVNLLALGLAFLAASMVL